MRIDRETGLVPTARQVPSPHHDARPAWATVDLVVIHGISLPPGEFGGPWIDQLFQDRLDPAAHPFFTGLAGLTVSAHFLIRRDGELVQYVPLHRRAWHAGISSFQGRADCNSWALGIELEGTDGVPYEDAQYGTLVALLAAVRAAFPAITPERIVGHAEIAPGRKTDPGEAFDWARIGDRPARRPAATR